MARFRLLIACAGILLILAIGSPAFAEEAPVGDSVATTVVGPAPAVVVEPQPAALAEEAWTFRFLVPTLLAMSGAALIGTLAAYGFRVRARYRVAR